MNGSIEIGKLIYQKLSSDEELKAVVGNRIYPIIAENSTDYPFIVYERVNVNNQYTKDGNIEDLVTFNIYVTSASYNQSISIASRVYTIFNFGKLVNNNNITYRDCKLSNITEQYNDAYIQTLTFEVSVIQ